MDVKNLLKKYMWLVMVENSGEEFIEYAENGAFSTEELGLLKDISTELNPPRTSRYVAITEKTAPPSLSSATDATFSATSVIANFSDTEMEALMKAINQSVHEATWLSVSAQTPLEN